MPNNVKIGGVVIERIINGQAWPFVQLGGGTYYDLPEDGHQEILKHITAITATVDAAHAAHPATTERFNIAFAGVTRDGMSIAPAVSLIGVSRATVLAYEQALLDAGRELLAIGKKIHEAKAAK